MLGELLLQELRARAKMAEHEPDQFGVEHDVPGVFRLGLTDEARGDGPLSGHTRLLDIFLITT